MPDQQFLNMLCIPLGWLFPMQRALLSFFMCCNSLSTFLGKYIFLLFPVLLWTGAIWCTMLAVYTLPFRSGRLQFISMFVLAWWDAVRAIWTFWVSLFRLAIVGTGWLFSLARLFFKFLVETVRHIVAIPFNVSGKMSKSYFSSGVPWLAFLMLMFWCLLEGTIFTYTLFPTMSEVLADIVGADEISRFTSPILFIFLFILILGSFAAIQGLVDSFKSKEFKYILQMILVELFVMFFEVIFLYREFVDAITPWIAQQTGGKIQMGIGSTLLLATFGWIGIRSMTWLLFGQFGTPPLVAIISRKPVAGEDTRETVASSEPEPPNWWLKPLEDFKQEITWLHSKSDELLEYLILPALQIFAAVLNFVLILVTSQPVFSLPFKKLKDVMDTRDILAAKLHVPRREEKV